jgi:hypothetical protein
LLGLNEVSRRLNRHRGGSGKRVSPDPMCDTVHRQVLYVATVLTVPFTLTAVTATSRTAVHHRRPYTSYHHHSCCHYNTRIRTRLLFVPTITLAVITLEPTSPPSGFVNRDRKKTTTPYRADRRRLAGEKSDYEQEVKRNKSFEKIPGGIDCSVCCRRVTFYYYYHYLLPLYYYNNRRYTQ